MATEGKLQRPYTEKTFGDVVSQFEDLLKELTLQDMEATAEERRQIISETLRFDQFSDRVRKLFGDDIKSTDIKGIFRKISTNPDSKIDWAELYGYQSSALEDGETPKFKDEGSVFSIAHRYRAGNVSMDKRRRDTTKSIRYVKPLDSYILTSVKGIVSTWNMKLECTYHTEIADTSWLVDCIYVPNMRKLVCCSERNLIIWDPRTKSKNPEMYIIKSFENSFLSMTYIPSTDTSQERMLLGDDQGYLTILTLSTLDLSHKEGAGIKRHDKTNITLITINSRNLIVPIRRQKIHTGWVLKLDWLPDLNCFISCCGNKRNSLVLEEIETAFTHPHSIHAAHIYKGVNTFIYSNRSNLIATGGADKMIRIWHPHIFSRPTGKLVGHLFTIVSMQINEKDQQIISLSSARVIRVWCLNTFASLQIFTDNDNRPGEKRIQSMFYDIKHDRLLTGSGVLDSWPLTRTLQDSFTVPQTHDRPVIKVEANLLLNQLITVCNEPTIKVWEADSGRLLYTLTQPHGISVTVNDLSVIATGYRMVSGAQDGSLKIWDVGAGQEIKTRQEKFIMKHGQISLSLPVLYVSYVCNNDVRYVIAAGWMNEIRLFEDSDTKNELVLLCKFDDTYRISTRLSSRNSTRELFASDRPSLPSIGTTIITGTALSSSKNLLKDETVYCMNVFVKHDHITVITGLTSGDICIWDGDKSNLTKVCSIPQRNSAIDPEIEEIVSSQHNKRVNAVGVLHHTIVDSHRKHVPSRKRRPVTDNSTYTDTNTTTEEDNLHSIRRTEDSREEQDGELLLNNENQELDDNETSPHMFVTSEKIFSPQILSLHEDAGIRFWTMEGELVHTTVAMTRKTGVPVCCYTHDSRCNYLVTGDDQGYITLWSIGLYLEGGIDPVRQIISWRGHSNKITSLIHIDRQKTIYSTSTDGSVRVWFGQNCRYLGFLGQSRALSIPRHDDITIPLTQPYDISEKPLHQALKPKRKVTKNPDVPLTFNRDSRSPFKRTSDQKIAEPEDKKFFRTLIKPRAYNSHLEPLDEKTTLNMARHGFVFRSLPVYRVQTPKSISAPSSVPRIDFSEHKQLPALKKVIALHRLASSYPTLPFDRARRKSDAN